MTKPITVPYAAPTSAQLREGRPGLIEAITAAETAIAAARAEQEAAFIAFTAEESDDTAKALWLAEQRVRARERRHADLVAELEAHDAATSATERRELEQRLEDIGAELANNRRSNELDAAATKAAVKLVDALLEIRQFNVQRDALRSEAQGLRERLGLPPELPAFHGVDASLHSTSAGLHELARSESDPIRRGYLLSLAGARVHFASASAAVATEVA